MEGLIYLAYLGVVLLAGLVCVIIAEKLKVSSMLLLLIAGIALGNVVYGGAHFVAFPPEILESLALLALVMVAFDSSSKINIRALGQGYKTPVLATLGVVLFTALLFAALTKYLFGTASILAVLAFAFVVSGTSSDAFTEKLLQGKGKVLDFLSEESEISAFIMIAAPLIAIEIVSSFQGGIYSGALGQPGGALAGLLIGIGAGIFMGILVFRFMKKVFSEKLSPVAVITAALLAYVVAEVLGGMGIVSVASMGIFFGATHVKQKHEFHLFSSVFSVLFEIVVVVLAGLAISLPLSISFILVSLVLFAFYIILRLITVMLFMGSSGLSLKESIFAVLAPSRGVASVAVLFALVIYAARVPGLEELLGFGIAFIVYSLVVSTVALKFKDAFLGEKEKIEK